MGNGSFIDGLPINSMVIFHGYVSHNQMVDFVEAELNQEFSKSNRSSTEKLVTRLAYRRRMPPSTTSTLPGAKLVGL